MLHNKSNIKSPCIQVCTLDEDKVCMGCYRTQDEIRNWFRMNDKEKEQVLKNSEKRRRKKEENNYDRYA